MVYYVGFLFPLFLQLPLLLVIPVVVTVVRITVVVVVPFVFVAVVAPWSEYQRAGLEVRLMKMLLGENTEIFSLSDNKE